MAWSKEQLNNAGTIIAVGRNLGASNRDIIISLMTAMQESALRNLTWGDRDSIGLFQQRDAWGTREQRLDPAQSAKMFFTGGHAGQRGLFDFADRDQMSLTQAAQAVQVSAFPDAYAKWEKDAKAIFGKPISTNTTTTTTTLGQVPGLDGLLAGPEIESKPVVPTTGSAIGAVSADERGVGEMGEELSELGDVDAEPAVDPKIEELTFDNAGPIENPMTKITMPEVQDLVKRAGGAGGAPEMGGPSGEGGWREGVEKLARKMLGTPYVWGGTSWNGVDCSGLLQLIFKEQGINLPRISADQARAGKRVGLGDVRAGDLIAWDNSSRNNGADHIALYIGNGLIIEAPRPGSSVQISNIYDQGNAWGVQLNF